MVQREPGDDGLVPPIKVLHKRVNGVYQAEGFRGPTRRYVLIVALLVGLASLPTLAAITAGSNELEDGTTGAMDVPFLPLPSSGPVSPTPSGPPATALPAPSSSPPATVPSPSTPKGQVQKRKTRPGYAQSDTPAGDRPSRPAAPGGFSGADSSGSGSSGSGSSGSGSSGSGSSGAGSSGSGSPGAGSSGSGSGSGSPDREWTWLPGSKPPPDGQDGGADSGDGDQPASPGHPGHTPPPGWNPGEPPQPGPPSPDEPERPGKPDRPGTPGRPGQPPCQDPGRGATRPSHHHRPDWSRHKHADDASHRAHWSHHREGRKRAVAVHVPASGRHGVSRTVREHAHDRYERPSREREREHGAKKLSKLMRSIVSSRSTDRSESSRRSAVAERPHNVRPARTAERTHNSRRHHHAADTRVDEPQSGGRSYRGSHRAERQHRAEDSVVASHRGSRMGHHHADHTGRW